MATVREITLDQITTMAKTAKEQINTIILHWSAGHYETSFPEYHINIDDKGKLKTHHNSFLTTTEHTYKRNANAIAVCINACVDATESNFGSCPPTDSQINSMATVVAILCSEIGIPCDIQHVMTHAEAANNLDGKNPHEKYGPGSGDEESRWDLWFWPGVEPGKGGEVIRSKAVKSNYYDTPLTSSIIRYDILSHKYESNGDVGSVSSGVGDLGGISYGLYQLASNVAGKVESFVEFCKQNGYSKAAILESAYPPGSSSFSNAWRQVAQEDPKGFGEIQYQYAYTVHFLPGVADSARVGIDLNKHSDALKCVVWSIAVQYPAHVTTAFKESAEMMRRTLSELDDIKYDKDFIDAIYTLRGSDEWINSDLSEDVKNGLRRRFSLECEYGDALKLLSGDGAAISKIIASNINSSNINNSNIAFKLGTLKPSDDGFTTIPKPHAKHVDSDITKLPKGKTFCEPIYPDLITIMDQVPQWLVETANVPVEKMIVGENMMYVIPTSVLREASGGNLDAILGSVAQAQERQRVFDPREYKTEFKAPNPGKPANNNDSFPVDLKIEELEKHDPRVKIYNITCCPEAIPVAEGLLIATDRAEKRLVKLENNMATLMRYIFRMASRVQINCVYYGGQTVFEKYNGIRCLQDDRLSDGQMMSIDQCLNCTRYEPIIGQVYEIINDVGTNLAAILDDNQMSYMDMKNYVDFTRVENYHNELPKAKIDMGAITTRNSEEKDFKDIWPKGIEIDWKLVPVEEQKPHINWRQSINNDGYSLNKLASNQNIETNAGRNYTAPPGAVDVMKRNANAMDANQNQEIQIFIESGKTAGKEKTDEFINRLKAGLDKEIKSKLGNNSNIDPLIIAAIMCVEKSTDIDTVVKDYLNTVATIGTDNPAVCISAYKAETIVFMGQEKGTPKLPRIDKVVKEIEDTETSGNPETTINFNLIWEKRHNWLWTGFAEPMNINIQASNSSGSSDKSSFFPKVCYVYLELQKSAKNSAYDGDLFAFPFLENQLSEIRYSSPFGMRQLSSEPAPRLHRGIDLGADAGTEIHAIQDGIVVDLKGWGCNSVTIQHENGLFSRYLHSSVVYVNVGQVVKKGDVIAAVGGYGNNGPNDYVPHLHLEISAGEPLSTYSETDPAKFFPLLTDKLGKMLG